MSITKITAAIAAGVCALAITGCGDDDEGGSTTAAKSGVDVTDVWTRVTAPTAKEGAVYMTITAADGDTLTKASVPTTIAGKTELHETTGGDAHSSMSGDKISGEMQMKPVSSIEIPAGKAVELKPGGYHVMLLELADPIEEGETVPVTLEFEQAGTVKVEATAKKSDM